jgi:hypothetical protein
MNIAEKEITHSALNELTFTVHAGTACQAVLELKLLYNDIVTVYRSLKARYMPQNQVVL